MVEAVPAGGPGQGGGDGGGPRPAEHARLGPLPRPRQPGLPPACSGGEQPRCQHARGRAGAGLCAGSLAQHLLLHRAGRRSAVAKQAPRAGYEKTERLDLLKAFPDSTSTGKVLVSSGLGLAVWAAHAL